MKSRTSERLPHHFNRTLTESAARTSMQSPPPGAFWCQITNNGKRPIPALLDTTPSFPINHSGFGQDQKKRKTFEQGHMHAKGQEKATLPCVFFFYFLKKLCLLVHNFSFFVTEWIETDFKILAIIAYSII